jgi:hypothetical protein
MIGDDDDGSGFIGDPDEDIGSFIDDELPAGDQDEGDQGGTFVDLDFQRWVRTAPRFVIESLVRADRGLPISPDALRIGARYVDELRAILARG